MDSDSDFDGVDHEELLKEIRDIGKPSKKRNLPTVKKAEAQEVDVTDLVGSIKSTRNVGDLKKQLNLDAPEGKRKKKKGETLSVPLHRQAQVRLESGIAYKDTKKELSEWDPVVQANRVAEQLVFPLNEDNTIRVETAAERVQHFEPRTELEKKMSEVLNASKYNLRNDELYTEAEKELIKAMNLKEAR
ncbi:Utp14 protein [Aphelenchoides avenae]|nr:Utp14 protein [Aphelenchus avenae]